MKALTGDGTSYGANDRGHESQGMDLDKASEMIIKSIEANKRETILFLECFPKLHYIYQDISLFRGYYCSKL